MPAEITLRPIGIIHSPHQVAAQTPIQPVFAAGITGTAEIAPEYAAASPTSTVSRTSG